MNNIILAKSCKDYEKPRFEETLLGHTVKVVESFECIFGTYQKPSVFAGNYFRFFKLSDEQINIFYINSLISCIFHDIGKSNTDFQEMVRNPRKNQIIRHEHLSGLLLFLKNIKKSFQTFDDIHLMIVISSIIGHHLKAKEEGNFARWRHPTRNLLKVKLKGVTEVFDYFFDKLSLSPIPITLEPIWSFDGSRGVNFNELQKNLRKELRQFELELRLDEKLNILLTAIRTAVILSDAAGSGLVREEKNISVWIDEALTKRPLLKADYIEKKIIQPRKEQIENNIGKFDWTDFQKEAEKLPDRALLIAPCGSGKTLAAWKWIKNQLKKEAKKRVIFLYPTRATATEGFKDYISWAPETKVSLVHGTADYELKDMFSYDERCNKDFSVEDRLFALAYWHRDIFSATVDQFLGFMQNVYRSICLLPLLVESVIVIDEIHSFDKNLFSVLKLFLKTFQVPILCMTASLPPERKESLVNEYKLTLFPEDIKEFKGLQKIADLPRYKVINTDINYIKTNIIPKAIKYRKRVLWVVNTVAECQTLAENYKTLCYHSAFKLDDRKEKHESVIKAFQQKNKGVLAITTQVCEMSLDLDADILISEKAPITSLIQRMGRCNRKKRKNNGTIGEVYIYEPKDECPYSKEDFLGVDEFIKEVDGKIVSQVYLEKLLQKAPTPEYEYVRYAAFLACGPWAVAREESLRDINNYSVQAILDTDKNSYLIDKKAKKPVDGYILPVPRGMAQAKIGRYPLVASSENYDPKYGFFRR